MSKVLLVSANQVDFPYPVYPLGMAVVAKGLESAGHHVRQYDCLACGGVDPLLDLVKDFVPDYIGISIRNVDNVDFHTSHEQWYLGMVRDLVAMLKGVSKAPVILGGAGFSLMPDEIMAYSGADHGIVGEGEAATPKLIADLNCGKTCPQIVTAKKARLAPQDMPPGLFEKKLVDFYQDQSGMLGVQTKRGCPLGCVYCSYPVLEGKKLRCRPATDVVDEMQGLAAEFNVNSFVFTDSVFNTPGEHHLAVAEELVKRDLGFRWTGFFMPANMEPNHLKLLIRSGLYAMEVGTDATSDATLQGMGKGFDFDKVFRFNHMCIEQEMPCAHFVIFGGPGETKETVNLGIANLEALAPNLAFPFLGVRILPGTKLEKLARQQGILSGDASLLEPVYYFSPDVDQDWISKWLAQVFRNHKTVVYPPQRGVEHMTIMRRFGHRGLIWDMRIKFPGRKGAGVDNV